MSLGKYLVVIVLSSVASFGFGQEIFLSSLDNRLYRFNLAGCTYQQIGNVPSGSTDISFHPNGNLYSVSSTGRLFRVEAATGTGTLVHSFEPSASQLYTSLTISADGIFYVCGLDGDLWSYTLATNTGTYLGNVGYPAEGDLTFYDGQLYMAASGDNIVRIDLNTPSNSVVVIDGELAGRIFGIVSYAATCENIATYAITSSPANLYEINFADQSLSFYCSLPFAVSGGASTYEFLGSNPVTLDTVRALGFSCTASGGSISVSAQGGIGSLSYSLDGQQFQASPTFSGLPVGAYTVYVQDEVGCLLEREVELGLDLPTVDGVVVAAASCGEPNGSIGLGVSGGTPPYSLAVNGGPSLPNLSLTGLAPGFYSLVVTDALSCQTQTSASVGSINAPVIGSAEATGTRCGQPNGRISVVATGGAPPLSYTLNGGEGRPEGVFADLAAGSYTVSVIDGSGCLRSLSLEVAPSEGVSLDTLWPTPSRCGEPDGSLLVEASGGSLPLRYSLNGGSPTDAPLFAGLAAGSYVVVVRDAAGCEDSQTAGIAPSSRPRFSQYVVQPSECTEANGAIRFALSGGAGALRLQLDGQPLDAEARLVEALAAGPYRLVVTDSLACADTLRAQVQRLNCPIYLPNVFSPNDDGVNDRFGPQAIDGLDARLARFSIFDRWGGLVFQRLDVAFADPAAAWDGRARGERLEPGLFVYYLQLLYPDGSTYELAGEVLLTR